MEKTRQKGFAAWFIDNWKRKPLFSTGIALLVMVVLQILALGFDYASFGEWFGAFSRNWINILRNNAGVGIIALGMTFVIISGGIDLAVGSTMVAIGAVIMSLIDSGSSGLLAGMGITGVPAYIIAIAVGILLGVLLGRFICGFLCPFGWFQELLHKIPTKKLSTKRLKPLTYLKYVILVVMVFLLPVLVVNEAGMGDPFFCKYLCPQGVLEGAIPLSLVNSSIRAALGKLFSWKLCVLITVVVLSVIFYRPFCKWLCPLGAFYALFNRVSLLSMHVDESKCVSCGKCARTCPMDVDVTKTPNHSECIRCGKCVTACPTEAVRFRYAFGSGGACSKLSQKPIIEENKGE